MALLLPFTYTLPPVVAIVMLASCYIGAEYGGSIPAILIRTPGTNAAAATILDGYEMNRQGRAGEALGISLWSGVVGGLFGLAMLILLTEPLSQIGAAVPADRLFRRSACSAFRSSLRSPASRCSRARRPRPWD